MDKWIKNGYDYYEPTVSFVTEYNVGRDGIGMVSQEFTVGQEIPAKLINGELMFLANYTTGGKHYATNILLDPTLFVQTVKDGTVIAKDLDYNDPETLIIAGLSIFLALIIKYD